MPLSRFSYRRETSPLEPDRTVVHPDRRFRSPRDSELVFLIELYERIQLYLVDRLYVAGGHDANMPVLEAELARISRRLRHLRGREAGDE